RRKEHRSAEPRERAQDLAARVAGTRRRRSQAVRRGADHARAGCRRSGNESQDPGTGGRGQPRTVALRANQAVLDPAARLRDRRGRAHADTQVEATDLRTALRRRDRRTVRMTAVFLVASAFLASAVEMVEALTIVLAVGVTRDWRSSLTGVGAATIALAAIVAALGPALTLIPIDTLRLVVGALLLVFGLQWLRKAILRASGYVSLHDEEAAFARETAEARAAGLERRAGLDWYAFTIAFKGVLLEGLEVAFIVLTFGSTQGSIPLAALGACGAAASTTGARVKALRRFGRFWWDFVIGDDWRIAAGVAIALGATAALAAADEPAWWLLPIAVATLLYFSLKREARR